MSNKEETFEEALARVYAGNASEIPILEKQIESRKCNCRYYEEEIKRLEGQIYDLKKVIKTMAKYIK